MEGSWQKVCKIMKYRSEEFYENFFQHKNPLLANFEAIVFVFPNSDFIPQETYLKY